MINDLIKQFASEAGLEICDCGCDAPEAVSRFAELIVRECIDVVLESNTSEKMSLNRTYDIMENIRERFGVE